MNKLKSLREEQHITSAELSEKTKVPYSTIRSYENGQRKGKTETWKILADYFGVSIAYIMGISDQKVDTKKRLESDLSDLSILKSKIVTNALARINDNLENLNDTTLVNNAANALTEYILQLDEILRTQDKHKTNSFIKTSESIFSSNGLFGESIFMNIDENESTPSGYSKPTKAKFDEATHNYLSKTTELKKLIDNYFVDELKKRYPK